MTSTLDQLLLASLLTVVLAVLLGQLRLGRLLQMIMYLLQGYLLWQISITEPLASNLVFEVFGQTMTWQFDGLSWFFAMITIGSALLACWYSYDAYTRLLEEKGGSSRLLQVALSSNVLAMLILLASGDFLSLFLGWELVSWLGVLLMIIRGKTQWSAVISYITYAVGGGMAILASLVLVYSWTGSLSFEVVQASMGQLNNGQLWTLTLLMFAGFSVKMGLIPFHLWQAPAYAYSAGPAAAFLGAISSRMGLFAFVLVLFKVLGIEQLVSLHLFGEFLSSQTLLLWIAAFSIIFPTYTALKQNDARLLLAWHGIGQGGYMMMGLLLQDPMGSAGGLLHVFNYATNQAVLFMAVFAIGYRTDTTDLNRLGGLVTRMPLSFVAMLVGIIGLAGLPPMNGFVSKWMVYRSLLNEGMPLLFLAAVIGTFGTILSVYKLIHNSFLGQLRVEHQQVEEAPWSMMIPMLLLSLMIFITGVAPGLVLEYVTAAQNALGINAVEYTLGGVKAGADAVGGDLDMLWVVGVLFAGFAIGAVLFLSSGKSKRVHQLDNYAGGHFLTSQNQYQYSDNFYAGLMHVIKPWYRGSFSWMEKALVSVADVLSGLMKSFFNQAHTAVWLLGFTTLLIGWVVI